MQLQGPVAYGEITVLEKFGTYAMQALDRRLLEPKSEKLRPIAACFCRFSSADHYKRNK